MKSKNTESFLISKDITIRDAMKCLDETAEKNLYIVDEGRQLIASLSDGDIRRALLKGIDLESSVSLIMNNSPKYVYENDFVNPKKVKQIMVDYQIESLPVVNNDKRIMKIAYWVDIFEENRQVNYSKKDNKVFILAGGIGSRLEPFTKIFPKPLVPFGDKPIIEKIMDKFSFYGFDEFILSVNYKGEMIKLYFSDPEIKEKFSEILFINEEFPLGTIGSLYLARDEIHETFFISNSDILIEEDFEKIFNFHKENKAILTIVGCIKDSEVPYGVLNTDERGFLLDIEEKPKYKHIINTGVYIAEPEIMTYIQPNVKQDITELINKLLANSEKISIFPIFEDQWFDVGQWTEYKRSIEALAK